MEERRKDGKEQRRKGGKKERRKGGKKLSSASSNIDLNNKEIFTV